MDKIFNLRNEIFTTIGIIGAFIAQLYGGWTIGMSALVITMCIDYVTGLLVAGIFHKSKKSEDGRLESHAGWKGLVKKCVTMLLVLVAIEIDKVTGSGTFVRDAVVIGFFANECVSVIENAGLMGMPLPNILVEAIEVLKKKADSIHFPKDKEEGE